jgi:23S rRNA (uracil1939-C5)-methyltransferase
LELEDLDVTKAEAKPTYEEIKKYVIEKNGQRVSNLDIAHVKRKYGLIERLNYNKSKRAKKQPSLTPQKEQLVMEALRHYKIL